VNEMRYKIDEIRDEMKELRLAKDVLGKALRYLCEVDWPRGIQEPDHAYSEMENALDEIQIKIDDLEVQIDYILITLGGI